MLEWFGFWIMCAVIYCADRWFLIKRKEIEHKYRVKFKWWEK